MNSSVGFMNFRGFVSVFAESSSFMRTFLFATLFSIYTIMLMGLINFTLTLLIARGFENTALLHKVFFVPGVVNKLLLKFA